MLSPPLEVDWLPQVTTAVAVRVRFSCGPGGVADLVDEGFIRHDEGLIRHDEGLIRHAGLSAVTEAQLAEAGTEPSAIASATISRRRWQRANSEVERRVERSPRYRERSEVVSGWAGLPDLLPAGT